MNTLLLDPELVPLQWGTDQSFSLLASIMAACQVTRTVDQSDRCGSVSSSLETAQTTEEQCEANEENSQCHKDKVYLSFRMPAISNSVGAVVTKVSTLQSLLRILTTVHRI